LYILLITAEENPFNAKNCATYIVAYKTHRPKQATCFGLSTHLAFIFELHHHHHSNYALSNMTRSLNALGLLLLLSLVSARHAPRSFHPHSDGFGGGSSVQSLSGIVAVGNAPPIASTDNSSSPCFPSADFQMPSTVPSSTQSWWCPADTEYAFLGFSYEVTACSSIISASPEIPS
jgi:hypothetical protein